MKPCIRHTGGLAHPHRTDAGREGRPYADIGGGYGLDRDTHCHGKGRWRRPQHLAQGDDTGDGHTSAARHVTVTVTPTHPLPDHLFSKGDRVLFLKAYRRKVSREDQRKRDELERRGQQRLAD